jgi:hypothetical protein
MTLTPEEKNQLEQLTYQQRHAAWQERETARLAELALLAPLDGVLDCPAVLAALELVDVGGADLETRNRISRIRTILTYDLGALLDRLARLQVAEPEPVAPEPVAP